jgi:sialic acid synthase SpsE
LVVESGLAWKALGSIQYGPTEQEKKSMMFRRSLYVAIDMKAGDTFTSENLRIIRPGFGLPPKYYDLIVGRRTNRVLTKGTAVTWDVLL